MKNSSHVEGKSEYEGMCKEVIQAAATMLNFTWVDPGMMEIH